MTDQCAAPKLMSLAEGVERLLSYTWPVTEIENVSLVDCLDRILVSDVIAPVSMPLFNHSAMDGYAVRYADLEKNDTLILAGATHAGHAFEQPLPEGHCIRVMTGSPLPPDADTVVMQEDVVPSGASVKFNRKPKKMGSHVRYVGEEVERGKTLLAAGRRITAQDVGLLASFGIATLSVYRQLKVALFSTGDELQLPGTPQIPNHIYDSNRFAVRAMLERLHVDIYDFGQIEDSREQIEKTLIEADGIADAVITSGGMSVGDADYVKDALSTVGETLFWKLAIKPGKPFAFGKLPNSVFFGLPGNPLSAMVTFYKLARPALLNMMGCTGDSTMRLQAICTATLSKKPGRLEFRTAVAEADGQGGLTVRPVVHKSSGSVTSISQSNCFIVIPAEQGDTAAGESVTVELFDRVLG